jgi:hypothetical protein
MKKIIKSLFTVGLAFTLFYIPNSNMLIEISFNNTVTITEFPYEH